MNYDVRETADPVSGPIPASPPSLTHIEVHGIDYIPSQERHGRPFELFWVWMGSNVNYLSFVFGGLLILIGLTVWEAIIVCVLGNLWWIAVGWLSVSGPASGTPSVAIMRAMFGIRGNRIFGAGQGLVVGLFYEIINITVATLATLAVLAHMGMPVQAGTEWVVLVAVAALSFVLSVYGHDAIVRASPWLTAALAAAFAVLAVFVFQAADYDFAPSALAESERWPTLLLGYAIVASGPLSWGTGADYSRYLPATSRKSGVVWWTALGGLIPTLFISLLGILAGTVIDMTDPQLTIGGIVPAWFTPVFLGIVVLGCVANNALVGYSAGLSAQGLGLKSSRVATVLTTGVIATVSSLWLTFLSPGFLATMEYALELTVTVLGPLIAIYSVDILLRRNRYNGIALNDERPGSPFWYTGGWYLPGVIAQLTGTTLALLMSNTTLYSGPLTLAMNGADLSAIVGPLVGGGLYALLWHTMAPFNDPALRPGGARDLEHADTPERSTITQEAQQ